MKLHLGLNLAAFCSIVVLWGCGSSGNGGKSFPAPSANPAPAESLDPVPKFIDENFESEDEDQVPILPGMINYGPEINQQDGPGGFIFTPSTQNYVINWAQFGEFPALPGKKVVYNGPTFGDDSNPCLTHGYSHTATATPAGRQTLLPSQRAIVWTSVAGPATTNWVAHTSPWDVSQSALEQKWSSYLKAYANMFPDTVGQPVPNVDLLISDAEKSFHNNQDILSLKGASFIPAEISAPSNEAFIDKYKRDMAALHETSHAFAKGQGFQGKLGSYGEGPVRRTYWGIDDNSWYKWTTDWSVLNYLVKDYLGGADWLENFGPYLNNSDVSVPSAYFFYDYPVEKSINPSMWNQAGDYLAYALFQSEVNAAWTDKEQVAFTWLRFHPGAPDSCNCDFKFIQPHMAHALAIFSMLGPEKTLWVWDHFGNEFGDVTQLNFSTYEYFVYGLYRLQPYSSLFTGNIEYFAPKNPRDLFVENSVVVRGLVNKTQQKLLVAVHNPYAVPGQVTTTPITLNGQTLGNVEVTGLNVALAVFDIPAPSCSGDLNQDGTVNSIDYGLFLADFGKTGPGLISDLNGDLIVDSKDQGILLAQWGPCQN